MGVRLGDDSPGYAHLDMVAQRNEAVVRQCHKTEGAPFDYEAWLLQYLRNEYTSAPVGSVLAYSNSAAALLRPVIDNVAPAGFKAYANDLFDRMGMPNTSYELDDRIPLERLSNAYSSGVLLPLLYGNLSTAGSIRSSVLDMAQYRQ